MGQTAGQTHCPALRLRRAGALALALFVAIGASALKAQTSPVVVHVARFAAFRSPTEPATADLIEAELMDALSAAGYAAEPAIGTDRESRIEAARVAGARYLIEGYYERRAGAINLNLHVQVYNPDTGTVIDAYRAVDELEGLEDVELDRAELAVSDREQAREMAARVSRALRSNPRRTERAENILESIVGTELDQEASFPLADEGRGRPSEEVFDIFAEKISVASYVETDIEKQPASVSVITRGQIRLSGARTLNEVLMIYVPGFFMVEDQDDVIAAVRGLAPDSNSKILMLLNGQNINTEWFWGPPDSILQGIDLNFIERIEVIRGPGSVTLGQGALLGVINVVTRDGRTYSGTTLTGGLGENEFSQFVLQTGQRGEVLEELQTYFYFSSTGYRGQRLRSLAWTREKDYEGAEGNFELSRGLYQEKKPTDTLGDSNLALWRLPNGNTLVNTKNVATSGNRLKRTDNVTSLGVIQYQGFEFTGFYTDQQRDNYNFYRDRNEIQNIIKYAGAGYRHEFGDRAALTGRSSYAIDDVVLHSHDGFVMGGTREYRYGGALILNLTDLPADNRLAIGVEFRRYDMGQTDRNGNNFILNRADDKLLDDVNRNRRYVFPESITVGSIFVEDSYSVTRHWDVFAAFRYDQHSFWGYNISPRLGTIFSPFDDWRFRLSYQQGFRGAPGVAFAGGFQKDGLLRTDNYQLVAAANIPTTDRFGNSTTYGNIPEAEPETIDSYEFAVNWEISESWSVESVFFYNIIRNIVDVGVIFLDPAQGTLPYIGTDEPGDWNGYFFFRNLPGEIRNAGNELSVRYDNRYLSATLSHSVVRIVNASRILFDDFGGGMYLSADRDNPRHRAYPENVSRANLAFHIGEKWNALVNYMYYANWYTPFGNRETGQHVLHGGLSYSPIPDLEIALVARNLLQSGAVWPMNSNAGGPDTSNGTPALEERTYWVTLSYTF